MQSTISLEDFQDAEPDILVHSMSAILKHFNQMETRCDVALKALCKKKGVHVEVKNKKKFKSLLISINHTFLFLYFLCLTLIPIGILLVWTV